MVVLGIDPGTDRVGYGVVEIDGSVCRMVTVGCITTTKHRGEGEKLLELYHQCGALFDQYQPHAVALESVFFAKNAKTAISVGQARGVILLVSQQKNRPLVSYAPLEVKLAITGYGKADKLQVQRMVQSILRMRELPQPDDAADALAIALTHCFSYRLKSLKR